MTTSGPERAYLVKHSTEKAALVAFLSCFRVFFPFCARGFRRVPRDFQGLGFDGARAQPRITLLGFKGSRVRLNNASNPPCSQETNHCSLLYTTGGNSITRFSLSALVSQL